METAIIKACRIGSNVKNTGKECDISMGATAMIICIPPSVTFTKNDLKTPMAWLTALIHDVPSRRAYPLFGQKAPIRYITNNAEGDVTITLDDGALVFLRYGMYNRTFETTSGGLCYAEALQSFNKENYSFIEIDQQGQMLVRKNADGTYGGLITSSMYSPSPILADLKSTVYRNRFQLTLDPVELVNNGVILDGAIPLLSAMGLIDTKMTEAIAASNTKLRVHVLTECAESDLVSLFATQMPIVSNFVVTNKVTGVVTAITGAVKISDYVELTGAFTSGQTYIVKGSAPSIWFTNGVKGYDASSDDNSVEITIP